MGGVGSWVPPVPRVPTSSACTPTPDRREGGLPHRRYCQDGRMSEGYRPPCRDAGL